MKQLEFILDENIPPLVKEYFTQVVCHNREKNPGKGIREIVRK